MKALKVSRGVIPIGEFKSNAASWLEELNNTGNPIVITQHGKPAAVLLTPNEFDRIQYKEAFMASIEKGSQELDTGRGVGIQDVEKYFEKRKKSQSIK